MISAMPSRGSLRNAGCRHTQKKSRGDTGMTSDENRSVVLAAIIVRVSLLMGLALGGYFFGKGATRFKSDTRTVTVKGLVEKEVKADQAIWVLRLTRAREEIRDAMQKLVLTEKLRL